MLTPHADSPLFVVVEPAGAAALEPPTRVAWACEREAGVAAAPDLSRAVERIAALAGSHGVYLADPLFDEPRLAAVFTAAGAEPPEEMQDWLMALAPLGQARQLAAMRAAAAERSDPDNPATLLYEIWTEARRRVD
jgi:hypothetical protein